MVHSRYTKVKAPWWHLGVLILLSALYEAAFLHHGFSRVDEGWTLYAARTLRAGGVLYRDAFFVFPPFHLLPAWIGLAFDPQGLVESRVVYAVFNAAAAVGVYLLGRRVMPGHYALFGALFLALGVPYSHLGQQLFGYRYIIFGMLTLLAFGRRLDTGNPRWLVASGLAAGIGICFRLTPPIAAAVAVGVGSLASARRWHEPFRDGALFGFGALIPLLPVLGWLIASVGTETLWREIVLRPIVMTSIQSLPVPALTLPEEWTRLGIHEAFVPIQFRLYGLLYAAYAVGLGATWWRACRRGRRFEPIFLLVIVVFGAVYFARTLGRSDEPHLDSALPPVCLLMAHGLSLLPKRSELFRRHWALQAGSCLTVFLLWSFLWGTDRHLLEARGRVPIHATGGRIAADNPLMVAAYDWCVAKIRHFAGKGDVVLDMTASPILHVLSDRDGPGGADIVMPGTFLDQAEEESMLARLERQPPAVVVWPRGAFDGRSERHVTVVAPRISVWIREHYIEHGSRGRFTLMLPISLGTGEADRRSQPIRRHDERGGAS